MARLSRPGIEHQAAEFILLGAILGGFYSSITGVSANGSVVGGASPAWSGKLFCEMRSTA
jgi:uncharacterized membrane protein